MPLESGDDVIMSITHADLVDWIIAEGVLASSLEALVSGLGQRLLERGFARTGVCRLSRLSFDADGPPCRAHRRRGLAAGNRREPGSDRPRPRRKPVPDQPV